MQRLGFQDGDPGAHATADADRRKRRARPQRHHARGAHPACAPSRPAGVPPDGAPPAPPPGLRARDTQAGLGRQAPGRTSCQLPAPLIDPGRLKPAKNRRREAYWAASAFQARRRSRNATADPLNEGVVANSRSTAALVGVPAPRYADRGSAGRGPRGLDSSTVIVAPVRRRHRATGVGGWSARQAVRGVRRYATSSRPCRLGSRDSTRRPSMTTANRPEAESGPCLPAFASATYQPT